jgi:DNA-binding transcriptional ArsR family regulator
MAGDTDPFADPRLTRALAHPTRSAILELLIGEESLSPGTISEKLGVKAANACYHLDVLAVAGALEAAPGDKGGEGLFRIPQPSPKAKKSRLDASGSMRPGVSEAQLKSLIETASDFPPGYARGA